jgi:hypothetical protein
MIVKSLFDIREDSNLDYQSFLLAVPNIDQINSNHWVNRKVIEKYITLNKKYSYPLFKSNNNISYSVIEPYSFFVKYFYISDFENSLQFYNLPDLESYIIRNNKSYSSVISSIKIFFKYKSNIEYFILDVENETIEITSVKDVINVYEEEKAIFHLWGRKIIFKDGKMLIEND